jgi:Holliday junction resolvase RusA-like endonuclease
MEQIEAICELEIPMVPPSLNVYWKVSKWGGRYITPEGVKFKKLCEVLNKGKKIYSIKPLRLEVEVFSKGWYTKKGEIHKRAGDCDNLLKVCCDGLFSAIGLDDSQIFEIVVRKRVGADVTRMKLFELSSI